MCPYVVVISRFTSFSGFTGFINVFVEDLKFDYEV